MTTENELDVLQTMDTSEKTGEIKIDESSVGKVEDEAIQLEKPKRGGRKKRDVSDVKTENSTNDHAMDTQPLFEQPVILEGKRSRKPTSRLELSDLATPKKELSIPQGHGKPLGEIAYVNHQINQAPTEVLSRMRNICFGRRASNTDIRKNLREFNGFEFERDSEEYQRHLSSLTKLKKEQLQSLADILGVSVTERNEENAERILNFLMAPVDDGKAIPERKMSMRTTKQYSTNSKESLPTDEDEFDDKAENDDDDDELFGVNDEEDEEGDDGTDIDYIGSDEDSGLNTKDDDPDDFVYQPGKKTPKKRTSLKRTRSKSTPKRKRVAPTRSTRSRKKSKASIKSTAENDLSTITPTEDTKTTESIPETKNDDLNTVDTKSSEQTDTLATSTTTADIVPTTD